MKISSGLVIIYDNKILLAHPTNNPWYHSYSIPKGNVEENEDILNAAIRETQEEVGLTITKDMIEPEQYFVDYVNQKNKKYKRVYYYIVRLSEINTLILPKEQLQLKEVDWAGFMIKNEAQERINYKLKDILKHLT